MDGRSEFFVYMGAALATITGLFVAQIWYASYVDVSVVHAQNSDAPMDGKLEAVRSAESSKLSGGAVSIEQAMRAVAEKGRAASPKLAAQPSEDLSAMSGWIHRPGFAAYEPRQAPPAVPAAELGDGGVPLEGAEAAPGAPLAPGAPATGAAPEAALKPKVVVGVARPLVVKPAVTKVKVAQ
jgi:hypothetical protein